MTKAKKHHPIFKLWINLRGLLAWMIILAGLAVGLLSLLLPFEALYKDRLEDFLEQQWGMEVNVQKIEGSWKGYGPYFLLEDLELAGKQSIQLASASLFINVYQLLIPGGRTGIDLSINQAELDMIHSADGASITINDDKDEARFAEMLDRVLATGSLRVDEMIFNVADQSGAVILNGLVADFLLEQDNENRALQIQVESDQAEEADKSGHTMVLKGMGQRTQSLTRDGQWYLNFNQFELSQLNDFVSSFNLPAGELDGEIWLTAASGGIQSVTGQLSWSNNTQGLAFDVLLNQQHHVENNPLNGNDKDWQALIKVHNIQVKNQQLDDFELLLQRDDDTSQVKASDIPMALVVQMMSAIGLTPTLDDQTTGSVLGQVDHFEISYDDAKNQWLGGYMDFSGFSMENTDFTFKNLTGLFEFNADKGELLLDSANGLMSIPEIYRGTLNWQQLVAQVHFDWQTPAPYVQVNNMWCACEDFDLQLWSDIKFEDNIKMILNSRLSAVEVEKLNKYWPHNIWKKKTLDWLDQGLLGGQVETGFVFVNGQMVHEGFKKGAAEFISRAYTKDVANQFQSNWPVVKGIDAIAEFDHDEVHVQLQRAHSLGLNISEAQVDIESFDVGVINVELNANSQNNEILNYIRNSPLVKNIELDENIRIGGKQHINLAFDVALKDTNNQAFEPQGQVVFSDGQFLTEHFTIDGINGPVKLDGYQLLMNDLPARLSAADVLMNGKIVTKSPHGALVDVDLTGSLKTDYLLDLIQRDLPITGESDWNINIRNLRKGLIMTAQSALSGVSIDLPAPLNKQAAENKTLEITCGIPCANSTVEINYNNEIKSTLSSEAGQYHLSRLQFIESIQDRSGNEDELFGGYIERLDLDQWLKLLSTQNASDAVSADQVTDEPDWPVDEIQLNIKQMIFMSRAFEDMALNIIRNTDSYTIDVASEAIKGQVTIDDDLQQKGIVAEFQHLNWIDPIEGQIEADTIDAAEEAAAAKIPDIHLWANQFSYADIPLGELRMEMRNVADGIKVEQLSLKSDLAEINISGTWNKFTADLGQSTFNIVMFSERIADFLQTVGFNAPITNAQTLIEMQAQWEGVPSQFNMATVNGDLEIKIGQGQVLDQEPGFGRVLGLFNLTNLPRRLILDFRDVLADGLLFSSMEGQFKITAGVANTEDFLIKASSAKIHISGDVGFADQSYDQTITVRPQIGKTFPTIGAIAGGPVGAAAGFLVQGLLDKRLKSSNEIIYQVTGTWDDPMIELVERDNTGKMTMRDDQ